MIQLVLITSIIVPICVNILTKEIANFVTDKVPNHAIRLEDQLRQNDL